MKKPSLSYDRYRNRWQLSMSLKDVGKPDLSLTFIPEQHENEEKVLLFDNPVGDQYDIVTDEKYEELKEQAMQNLPPEHKIEDWESETEYTRERIIRISLGVHYEEHLKHMRRVWDALDLLVHIN